MPLAQDVFELRTESGSEHFAYQGRGHSQIFKLILVVLSNVDVVVAKQV